MGKKESEFLKNNLGNMKQKQPITFIDKDEIILSIILIIITILVSASMIYIFTIKHNIPEKIEQKIENQLQLEEQNIRDNQPQLWR